MRKFSLSMAWQESKAVFAADGHLLASVGLALVALPIAVANFVIPTLRPGVVPEMGLWVVILFLGLVVSLSGLVALVKLALGRQVSVREAIQLGFRRILPLVVAIMAIALPLAFLAVGLTLSSLTNTAQAQQIAPGMFFLLILVLSPLISRFLLLPSTAAAESGGPIAILRRTWIVGRKNTFRLWGTFLAAFLVWGLVELAFNVGFGSVILIVFGQAAPMSLSKLAYSLGFGFLRACEAIILSLMLARIYAQLSGREVTDAA